MKPLSDQPTYTSAFNLGCDARLAGATLCPFRGQFQCSLREAWWTGWHDVDVHWGEQAPLRRHFRPLPAILDPTARKTAEKAARNSMSSVRRKEVAV